MIKSCILEILRSQREFSEARRAHDALEEQLGIKDEDIFEEREIKEAFNFLKELCDVPCSRTIITGFYPAYNSAVVDKTKTYYFTIDTSTKNPENLLKTLVNEFVTGLNSNGIIMTSPEELGDWLHSELSYGDCRIDGISFDTTDGKIYRFSRRYGWKESTKISSRKTVYYTDSESGELVQVNNPK